MLYLENDLATSVFTASRTAMLELLAPQAANSLEAARLYAELVTENGRRRQTEKALRNARADLARTSHLTVMGGLAASIAHEINQPLTSVVSNAAAGLRWLRRDEPDVPEALLNLREIQQNAMRAAEIVRALRSLAKQAPATLDSLDVDAVIREVLTLTSAEIESGHVSLVLDLRAGSATVLADRVQLQQVVLNLVINAVEAMSGVDETQRRLAITSVAGAASVVVTVRDAGPGVTPEARGRIFDPLFTTKASGMGMGLAICRSIMEAHGGSLHLSEAPDEDSTFVFTLPLAPG